MRRTSPTQARSWGTMCAALFFVVTVPLGLLYLCHATSREQTLENFAAELPDATWPSAAAYHFVASLDERLTSDEKLARLYNDLKERWRYVQDPLGEDHFKSAEIILSSPKPEGDCEDFVSAMVAISKALNLSHRVWLGHSEKEGHVWLEVFITAKSDLSPVVYNRLQELFRSHAEIVRHPDGLWLRLASPGSLNRYQPTHYIDVLGKLHPVSELSGK